MARQTDLGMLVCPCQTQARARTCSHTSSFPITPTSQLLGLPDVHHHLHYQHPSNALLLRCGISEL
ncbi:uncharacterized protein B0I36DRAFT_335595 [Microdochium trichocladiopsis]|uniref:Uncharacterized protein n=1 Tax=Microdochium trichocladiopsis TaxID=1682393 RepID=A0A9P8XUB2_9PEZI|nr:uncharacterized protein B0I36DRAFT_335595 [Microdochium trichocladiopsis]KAH7018262.1 hypothetical protein B0I36DRAFT_335595 [Microdochium trichocladiopsis]